MENVTAEKLSEIIVNISLSRYYPMQQLVNDKGDDAKEIIECLKEKAHGLILKYDSVACTINGNEYGVNSNGDGQDFFVGSAIQYSIGVDLESYQHAHVSFTKT